MVSISLDVLLPPSRASGQGHGSSLFGLEGGMALMALSLLLMQESRQRRTGILVQALAFQPSRPISMGHLRIRRL